LPSAMPSNTTARSDGGYYYGANWIRSKICGSVFLRPCARIVTMKNYRQPLPPCRRQHPLSWLSSVFFIPNINKCSAAMWLAALIKDLLLLLMKSMNVSLAEAVWNCDVSGPRPIRFCWVRLDSLGSQGSAAVSDSIESEPGGEMIPGPPGENAHRTSDRCVAASDQKKPAPTVNSRSTRWIRRLFSTKTIRWSSGSITVSWWAISTWVRAPAPRTTAPMVTPRGSST